MKKICTIGHFGVGRTLLNGQTIKTKVFTDLLVSVYGKDEVLRVDTHGGIKVAPLVVINTFIGIIRCKNIVIFSSDNGLKVLVPLLGLFNVLFRRKLHYIVIGGYLQDYLKGHAILERLLKKYSGIYVETEPMKIALEIAGFRNVSVMPNCKKISIIQENQLNTEKCETFRFCTFSRVMKSKGIEDAVDAIEAINKSHRRTVCKLTIYGQVDSEEIDWFEKLKARISQIEGISYGGCVSFDKSVEVLKDYYGLLFPTYYEGEGFAGTLIDAFAAGLPVIATDWHYNSSIIENNHTGFIYPTEEKDKLKEKIGYAINNQENWTKMRFNCIAKARELSPLNVIKTITNKLD